MSTKKQPTADLPTKTKSPFVRPSHAKDAIAAKKAAKVAAAHETGDWSKVSDADVQAELSNLTAGDFALPSRDEAVAVEVKAINSSIEADFVDRDAAIASVPDDVPDDVRDAFLEAETTMAVAALDAGNGLDHPEVIRSLAEAGLGADPFAEENAARRLAGKPSIADEFADQVSDSTWDFTQDEETLSAAAYEEAALAKLNHKITPNHGDGVLSTALTYYDPVLELEAELKTAETARVYAQTAMRETATDLAQKRGPIERQDARIEALELANARLAGRQTADEKTIAHLDGKIRDCPSSEHLAQLGLRTSGVLASSLG